MGGVFLSTTRARQLSILTVLGLVGLGLASVSMAQTAPSVSIVTSFGERQPCKEEWVTFDAKASADGALLVWYVNGVKDPHGYGNSTTYKFQVAGVGSYSVAVEAFWSNGGSARASLSFSSMECSVRPSESPQPTSGQSAYAHIWVKNICIQTIEISGELSEGFNKAAIASYAWTMKTPAGKVLTFSERLVSFAGDTEGYYLIHLDVKDVNGNMGSADRTDYYFYGCGTEKPTQTAAPTTAAPADPETCRRLQQEAQDYKYAYYEKYDAARARGDEAAMRQLDADKEAWVQDWQARYRAAGCEYGAASGECGQVYQEFAAEIGAFKARIQQVWEAYWNELEEARRQFAASGPHTDAEWKSFEEKWRMAAQDLHTRVKAEVEAFLSKHPRLAQCGFDYSGAPTTTQYKEAYASPPVAVDPYSQKRAECENKIIAIKDQYASRFADLYRRLASLPPESSEYASLRQQIASLEDQVRQAVERIMQECRQTYEGAYEQPQNYRDGAGALSCYYDDTSAKIVCHGKYVAFIGNPQTQTLSRYSCGGQLFFDELYSNTVFEDFTFADAADGGTLQIRSSNLKIVLHDSPRGVINVGVVGGAELYFVPAVHLDVTIDDRGSKVLLAGTDSSGVWLGGDGTFAWDEAKRVITVKGEGTWISESCLPDGSKPDGDRDARYWAAIEKRRLGAQVVISLSDNDDVNEDKETYDEDMRVQVRKERANKYEATIDSADGDCKTVVLKFDSEIFSTIKLKVSLTDENGNQLTLQEADDLEDVLEPCDDGDDGFEYWVVLDRYGTQVIVSFAHFSEKRVSVEAASVGNIVVPGFGGNIAVLGLLMAAAVVVVGRRRLTP